MAEKSATGELIRANRLLVSLFNTREEENTEDNPYPACLLRIMLL